MADEKRLIDANTLYEELSSLSIAVTGLRAGKGVLNEFMKQYRESVLRIVGEQATVDAVEVVYGRWLFVTKGQQTSVYVCSECNRAVTVVCDEDKIKEQLAKKYPYCHCGAKMDGDGNG